MSQSTPTPDTTARTETAGETPDARSKRLTDVLLELGAGTDMEPDDIRNAIAEHPEFGNEIARFAFDWLTMEDPGLDEDGSIPADTLKAATQAFHQISLVANDKDCIRILAGYLRTAAPALASPQHPVGVREALEVLQGMKTSFSDGGSGWADGHMDGWNEALEEAIKRLAAARPPAQDAPGAAKGEADNTVEIVDRAYDKCIRIAERAGSPELAAKLREEKEWEGLGCSCGGGWKVGHQSNCPEALAALDPSPPLPEADGEVVAKLDAILAKQPVAGNPDGESGNWGLHNDWRGWWKKLFMPAVAEFRATLVSTLRERDNERELKAHARKCCDEAEAAREKAEQAVAGLRKLVKRGKSLVDDLYSQWHFDADEALRASGSTEEGKTATPSVNVGEDK